jgi:DNA-directed RNA polymerase subunit L
MQAMSSDTAIEKDGYVYPIINPGVKNSNLIGVRDYGGALKFNKPIEEQDKSAHASSNIIDLQQNNNGVVGMIQKTAELEAAERTVLICKDNVTQFVIKDNDAPEFALLKKALNQKNIDMTSYRHRHGSDYSNNMRILTTADGITFGKMKAIAEASDIEIELIMRDKPGCANPIGEELHETII